MSAGIRCGVRHAPGVTVTGVSAGLHVYLADLDLASATRAREVLRARGLASAVVPTGPLHHPAPGLVVAFAALRPQDADHVARALAGELG